MNRKWQGAGAASALSSLLPFNEFQQLLPRLTAPLHCAQPADCYSVYSLLHSRGRACEFRSSCAGTFHYLLAQTQGTTADKANGEVRHGPSLH